ncbi:hypothetical protein [Umezawaea sp. Da 62-37]|uniref:hypothetical protein n=1 Tax=Umezawaea sp. Da 62-37 TaxID=3075927 RepID=UPI0028F6EFDF|nr:hypothetical protein [Umezawaea sp. Da 62-37]WNV87924.1 hypothetical protein RM788_06460 [Umezawaea sp. Da 62-37]
MAVENWDRYGTLIEKVAEDRDFWSGKASVDEVRAALPEYDHELLDELIAEVGEDEPDALLRYLRDAFTAMSTAGVAHEDERQPVGQESPVGRYFRPDMSKVYDETFGWVPIAELPEGERVPRIGDVYSEDGESWVPFTAEDVADWGEITTPAPVAQQDADIRYYDSTLTRFWDPVARTYQEAVARPPVVGVDRRFTPEGDNTELITSEMLTERTGKRTRSADQSKDDLKAALDGGVIAVVRNGVLRKATVKVPQDNLGSLLDSVGVPGTADIADLKEKCRADGYKGTWNRVYVDDNAGLGFILTLDAGIDRYSRSAGDNPVDSFRARVTWRLNLVMSPDFQAGLNRTAVAALQRVDDTAPYLLLDDLVVLGDHGRTADVVRMFELISRLEGGGRLRRGTVRRTTRLRRPVLKTDGGKPVHDALRAAGWKDQVVATD